MAFKLFKVGTVVTEAELKELYGPHADDVLSDRLDLQLGDQEGGQRRKFKISKELPTTAAEYQELQTRRYTLTVTQLVQEVSFGNGAKRSGNPRQQAPSAAGGKKSGTGVGSQRGAEMVPTGGDGTALPEEFGLDRDGAGPRVPPELRALGITPDIIEKLRSKAKAEREKGPVIALIGETGVGKTSTVNALFNAGRAISHVRPCTMEPGEIEYVMDGSKGAIRIIDMPGLGQSIKMDEEYYSKYVDRLPGCDTVAWLFQADVRAMTTAQTYLRRLVEDNVLAPDRLVIAVNKIDVIQPGEWSAEANLPSEEQERSVEEYKNYVKEVLGEIGIDIGDRVVAYSANKRYDLHKLFHAMLSACPLTRLWLLYERKDLASFTDLVDPKLLNS
jgi:predicted GTPase